MYFISSGQKKLENTNIEQRIPVFPLKMLYFYKNQVFFFVIKKFFFPKIKSLKKNIWQRWYFVKTSNSGRIQSVLCEETLREKRTIVVRRSLP